MLSADANRRRIDVVQGMALAYQQVLQEIEDVQLRSAIGKNLSNEMQNWAAGDIVWLYEPHLSQEAGSRKMFSPWSGPHLIVSVRDNKTVVLHYPLRREHCDTRTVNVDRLRRYFAPLLSELPGKPSGRVVQQVLARRLRNGQPQYLVKWLSIQPVVNSWVPPSRLPADLLDAFYRRNRLVEST